MYRECNFGENRPYSDVMGRFVENLKEYYANPSAYWMEPFRIYGNLYYVGDRKVCMHPEKNPFVNPDAWHIFLHSLEERRLDFERRGY